MVTVERHGAMAGQGTDRTVVYIDISDVTERAIGMTGRFLRGRRRDIILLTLIVSACIFALTEYSDPWVVSAMSGTWSRALNEGVLSVLPDLLLRLFVGVIGIWALGALISLFLTFIQPLTLPNLYWARRSGAGREIPHFGVTLRKVWQAVHGFRERTEAAGGLNPTRARLISRSLRTAALVLFAGQLLGQDSLWSHIHPVFSGDRGLFIVLGLCGALYLMSNRVRQPLVGDKTFRARFHRTRLMGLGALALYFAVVYAVIYLSAHYVVSPILDTGDNALSLRKVIGIVAMFAMIYLGFRLPSRLFAWGRDQLFAARLVGRPQADDVEARDPRPPIVLLRSFQDELSAEHGFSYERLEQTIERALAVYGPCVAAGTPGRLAEGPFGRKYFGDEDWKEGLGEYLEEATLLVMIPGWTEGLKWEVEAIRQRGYLHKLLIILLAAEDDEDRWAFFSRLFEGTPWHGLLSGADIAGAVAAFFREDGTLVILKCRDMDQARDDGHDYEVAVHLAVYGLYCHGVAGTSAH